MTENQFGQKISVFQSVGGGEFVNNQFLKHLADCGIKHFLSCPHTPQQNGLAERKHRHVIELGMSMLFQGNLPKNLWVEAIYTANFLINLLPTSVHDKLLSPFEKLSGQAPVYMALRVFGCACYPYLRPYAKNKFDPKSLVCVFLGYSEHHKGYRCLHPPTGKVYINRHVLFDESRFPYKDCYRSLLKPVNTPLLSAWYSQQQVSESDQQQPKQSAPVEPEVISPPIQTTTVTPTQAETPPESPVSNQDNNSHHQVLLQNPLTLKMKQYYNP